MKTWKSYQVFWEIQPKTIYDKLGEETIKCQALMEELKNRQRRFNILETEKIIGSIVIDFASVQTKVKNKCNIWHKELMKKFAQITNDGMEQFNSTINEARNNLEGNSLENKSNDIVSYIAEIQNCSKNKEMWKNEMEKYKNSCKILDSQRYRFKGDFFNMERLESEWNRFEQILNKKTKEMEDKIPSIKDKVKGDKAKLDEDIKNLDKYWSDNKPETADNPIAALNILKKTTEKINAIKDAYSENCQASELLGLEFGNPNKIDNMTQEVDDFKKVWNSLNTIYSKIDSKKETPFLAINPDKIKKDLDEALQQMTLLPSEIKSYYAYIITEKKLKTLKKMNNIIGDLRKEAIKDRHLKQILKRLNIHKNINELILNDFWKSPLLEMEKYLNEIICQAIDEFVLES